MKTFLTTAAAVEIHSGLPVLRARYSSESSSQGRFAAAVELADRYERLGLTDRASDWLRVASSLLEETVPEALQFRYHAISMEVWLAREDGAAAGRSLDQLKSLPAPSVEDERRVMAGAVRHSLLQSSPEPFAPLERAFRHLRHHPSPSWSARFLIWRAEWQLLLGRDEEALATLKKALADAQKGEDFDMELQGLLTLAMVPNSSKTKAIRSARVALEKALAWDIPGAVIQANWALSQLTAGHKESEASIAFKAFFETDRAAARQNGVWDRGARESDEKILEEVGQDRRRSEAQTLALISGRLAEDADLSRCLDGIYLPLKTLMAADVFGIALLAPDQKSLDYALFIEEGRRTRVGLIPVDSSRSLGAWCFREKQPIRINDIDHEYGMYLKELSKLSEHRPKSMLFQPLLTEKGVRGIVTVQSFSRGAYSPEAAAQLSVIGACVALRLQAGPRSEG